MVMINPNDGAKYERNPEEGNIPTGVYTCELTRAEEIGPSPQYPGGNNRLVFEFTVIGGEHGGKKAVTFIGKTLHKSKDGRESNLVKWARMMGIQNPEAGKWDTDVLVGKRYQVTCELTPAIGDKPPRAFARSAIATNDQPQKAQFRTSASPPVQPQHNGHAPQAAGGQLWDASDGKGGWRGITRDAVQAIITDRGWTASQLRVKPAGAPNSEARTADEMGFSDAPMMFSQNPEDDVIPF
jgi:hypothetical protein